MKYASRITKQEGLSLIEVVVSMGMLIALFALYATALNTMAVTKHLRYQNLAYHVANTKMEELRGTPFNSLPASGNIANASLSEIPSGAGNFTVSNAASFNGMKEITVTVTWTEGSLNKQVQLKTLAGTGGVNP